ncbi:MAG: flagellar hook capping protein [Planctomycetaceae bacterium]|nr:flagellar hook capping protein [Planctomycetaceae bacterium]
MDVTGTSSASTIDQQQFLNLLVTQLKHQDPLNPMDQQEQIAQLAQFSTVEGIEKLNASFSQMLNMQMLTSSSNMLGATVEYNSEDSLLPLTGTVERIATKNGSLQLTINGEQVPIENVLALVQPSAA